MGRHSGFRRRKLHVIAIHQPQQFIIIVGYLDLQTLKFQQLVPFKKAFFIGYTCGSQTMQAT